MFGELATDCGPGGEVGVGGLRLEVPAHPKVGCLLQVRADGPDCGCDLGVGELVVGDCGLPFDFCSEQLPGDRDTDLAARGGGLGS
jgi:hypothetical protein